MKAIKGLILLTRPELPFAAGLCVILGQVFAMAGDIHIAKAIAGFGSVFMVSASILVMNDCIDLESDKINAPHRPIPSGMISIRQAWLYALILMISGLCFSLSLGIYPLIIALCLVINGFLYNRYFKSSGLPGNLMVSSSVGATFIYGAASVGTPWNIMAAYFAVLVALIDLGEEISADAMDIEGDKLIRSRSVAIVHGTKRALKLSLSIFWIVITLSFIPFIFRWFPLILLLPVLIMDAFIGYSSIKMQTASNAMGRKYIKALYLGATLGMLIFLAMLLLL